MKEKRERRPAVASPLRDVRNLGDVVISCRNNSKMQSLQLLNAPWNVYVIYFIMYPGLLGMGAAFAASKLFNIEMPVTKHPILGVIWAAVAILILFGMLMYFNHVPQTPVLVLFEKGILYKKSVIKTSEIAEIYLGTREGDFIKNARKVVGSLNSRNEGLMNMTENSKAAAISIVRISGDVLVLKQAYANIDKDDLDALLLELQERAPEIKFVPA